MSKQYVYKAPILGVKYNRYRNNVDDNEIEQTTQTISLEWKYSLNDKCYLMIRKSGEKWDVINGKNLEGKLEWSLNKSSQRSETNQDNWTWDIVAPTQIDSNNYSYEYIVKKEDIQKDFYFCIFDPDLELYIDGTTNFINALEYDVCVKADTIPPSVVTDFKVESEVKCIKISWNESNDDIWDKTFLVRKRITNSDKSEPQSIYDQTCEILAVTNHDNKFDNEPYIDITASPTSEYYYRCFVYDKFNNVTKTVSIIGKMLDITPPGAAEFIDNYSNVLVMDIDKGIELEWTNPNDDDFSHVRIVKVAALTEEDKEKIKNNPYALDPIIPLDGELVYEGNGTYFDDKNIELNVKYCYKIFAYDTSGNINYDSKSIIRSIDCGFKVDHIQIIPTYFEQNSIFCNMESTDIPIYINKNYNNFGLEVKCNVGTTFGNNLYIVRTADEYDMITSEAELLGKYEFDEDTQTNIVVNQPKCLKYCPLNDIEENTDGTFNRIFYDFNASKNDSNKPITNDTIYCYTSYIRTIKENGESLYFRQELCCIRIINFASYTEDERELAMKKFNEYFTSFDTKWEIGESITNPDKYLPYFKSNKTCSTITMKNNQLNKNNDIENIKFVSYNCEFYGWIGYGYMSDGLNLTTNNDYVQLYEQSYKPLFTELNDYNKYKNSRKCFIINNDNIEDNFLPAIRVDINSKLIFDSAVISYNDYDIALDNTNTKNILDNEDGSYTAIKILKSDIRNNVNFIDNICEFKIKVLDEGKINYIKLDGNDIDFKPNDKEITITLNAYDEYVGGTDNNNNRNNIRDIFIIKSENDVDIMNIEELKTANIITKLVVEDDKITDESVQIEISDAKARYAEIQNRKHRLDLNYTEINSENVNINVGDYVGIIFYNISSNYDYFVIHVSGNGYTFEDNKCEFNAIALQRKNIDTYENMFKNCTGLTTMPRLSKNVTNCFGMFEGCKSLVNINPIPMNVTECSNMFKDCISLIEHPKIPLKVRKCVSMFAGCLQLRSTQNMPYTVKDISNMYDGCIRLTTIKRYDSERGLYDLMLSHDIGLKYEECFKNCISLIDPLTYQSLLDTAPAWVKKENKINENQIND